jgi:anti-sigma factor RsiW
MNVSLPDLSCQELVELVTDYLEGQLPEDDRARFEIHLGYCDACRKYLGQMRQVLSTAGKLRDDELQPEAMGALLEAFRAWKKGPGSGPG